MILPAFAGEQAVFDAILRVWLGIAALTFVALQFLSAPYGRHARPGWGPTLPRAAGWVLMECPAVLGFVVLLLLSERRTDPVCLVLACVWLAHYVNRTFVFPFRMRGGNVRMPLSIAAMGHFFNLVNAYLQARYLFTLGPQQGVEWLADSRFLSGLAVFAAGFCINLHSDHVLRNLRGAADSGYKVPHRGMFRFVSCPNYLGEIVEWCGWALMTWSLPGLAFALWTAANLAPRARSHHRWYVKTFPDYPAGRRALVPFLW